MLYTVTAYARYFEIKVLGFEGNPFLRVRSVKYYLGFVERNGGRGGIHGLHEFDSTIKDTSWSTSNPLPRRKKRSFDLLW